MLIKFQVLKLISYVFFEEFEQNYEIILIDMLFTRPQQVQHQTGPRLWGALRSFSQLLQTMIQGMIRGKHFL